MAWSAASVTAAELAASALDKPIFAAKNALRAYNQVPAFFTTRTWAGTQIDNANTPGRWVHDDSMRARARPADTTTADVYLLFDLDDAAGHEIDTIIIANHNFADLPGTVSVGVSVADNSAFTSNPRTLVSWASVTSDARLVALDLANLTFGDRRYSAVRYLAIGISTTSTFSAANGMPEIGEVFAGRRRQLARKHDRPGDDRAESSRLDVFESDAGYMTVHRRAYRRRDVDLTWFSDQNDALGLDDVATWRAIWDDTEGGTRPLWYLREPTTTPGDAVLLRAPSPRLIFENSMPQAGARAFAGVEQPPFYARET